MIAQIENEISSAPRAYYIFDVQREPPPPPPQHALKKFYFVLMDTFQDKLNNMDDNLIKYSTNFLILKKIKITH